MKRFSVEFGLQLIQLVQCLAGAQSIDVQVLQQIDNRVWQGSAKQVILGGQTAWLRCRRRVVAAFKLCQLFFGGPQHRARYARQFGNLRDPDSQLKKILTTKRVYILKEEAGTIPRFYYWFDR